PGGRPEPEGRGRGGAWGGGDAPPPPAALHPPPRRVAQLKNVAGAALYREVLVQRPHEGVVGIGDDPIVRDLRDRAAGRDGEHPRGASSTDASVDFVTMNERRAAAALGGKAVRGHSDDGVEVPAGEIAGRAGTPHPP